MILSYRLVGYPLAWVSSVSGLGIDGLFLWFNYFSLIAIGLTIFFVFTRLLNQKAGWIALVITLFGTQSILFQFYYGQIFNAINVGIFFPLLFYFSVRYLMQGRIYQLALALIFAAMFGAFHTSGIYLPAIAGFSLIIYLVFKAMKREAINRRALMVGLSIVSLALVAFLLSITNTRDLVNATIHNLPNVMKVPVSSYILGIVSPTILVMAAFALVYIKDIGKMLDKERKVLVVILACASVVLGVAAFVPLSLDPFRQALDLATILSLMVAVVVSVFVWNHKNQVVWVVLFLAIGFGLLHNLPTWMGYNSAISKADKEAIAYVNSLGYSTYNTSPEVAFWIYDRFTKAKYSENATEVLVERNIPMTPMSDPQNKWYQQHGEYVGSGYKLLGKFADGKIIVTVYENLGGLK
jgi:hypothetical protein